MSSYLTEYHKLVELDSVAIQITGRETYSLVQKPVVSLICKIKVIFVSFKYEYNNLGKHLVEYRSR